MELLDACDDEHYNVAIMAQLEWFHHLLSWVLLKSEKKAFYEDVEAMLT